MTLLKEYIDDPRKFMLELKNTMSKSLQEGLESSIEALPSYVAEDVAAPEISREESDALMNLRQAAKHLGSDDEGHYQDGQLTLTFTNKQSVQDYCAHLEECDAVDSYDIEIFSAVDNLGNPDEPVDLDSFEDTDETNFMVFVYLNPDIVSYSPEYVEVDEEGLDSLNDENGVISEVTRKIKINFRGKRRVKMQCRPGFKWDPSNRVCKKIGGAELATKRKALRQAVRTKKAQGSAFKRRVERKTKRANKFRKSFGL